MTLYFCVLWASELSFAPPPPPQLKSVGRWEKTIVFAVPCFPRCRDLSEPCSVAEDVQVAPDVFLPAWLVGWLLGLFAGFGWLVGCLVAWLLGCLVAWLLGCLVAVAGLLACLAARLVGGSVGLFVRRGPLPKASRFCFFPQFLEPPKVLGVD